MNVLIRIITILTLSSKLIAQSAFNLVPNYSFEKTNVSCPINNISDLENWYPSSGTPDYYNTCSVLTSNSVPNNWMGNQNPKTGQAYLGIATSNFDIREYIQIKLNSKLKEDKCYKVFFMFL